MRRTLTSLGNLQDRLGFMIVSDCGGHGRALEMMVDVFEDYPARIGPNVKSMVTEKLK